MTPEDDWPHHIDHESLGVSLVKQLCERIRVSNEHRDIAIITARYHSDCHQITERRPATIVKILEAMDAFRKPERVKLFVLACEADSRGRKGMEKEDYPQAALFSGAFEAADSVDTGAIAVDAQAAGLGGDAIGNRIHEARVNAVKELMAKQG